MNEALDQYGRKRIETLEEVELLCTQIRAQGKTIVLTSWTFDICHIGHSRYLIMAKSFGDVLFVGVDGDLKVKSRKGKHRPIVDQDERAEFVTHIAPVDFIYVKQLDDPHWALIKAVRPDILVTSIRQGYAVEEIIELKEFCGKVVVLESQAETSTSARIRDLIIGSVAPLLEEFTELEELIESMRAKFISITGGDA